MYTILYNFHMIDQLLYMVQCEFRLFSKWGLMFLYVFLLKISEVLGAVAGVNSLLYVWMPNIMFAIVGSYLFYNARK